MKRVKPVHANAKVATAASLEEGDSSFLSPSNQKKSKLCLLNLAPLIQNRLERLGFYSVKFVFSASDSI
ncbi:hypothetical protein K1719_007333 [Acacia pycnantha]|nr:hypothetical protein K1719_007333 [Acacia pycnantha]